MRREGGDMASDQGPICGVDTAAVVTMMRQAVALYSMWGVVCVCGDDEGICMGLVGRYPSHLSCRAMSEGGVGGLSISGVTSNAPTASTSNPPAHSSSITSASVEGGGGEGEYVRSSILDRWSTAHFVHRWTRRHNRSVSGTSVPVSAVSHSRWQIT